MNKVAIIGCGGAGKSHLARRLGDILGLPVIHLDAIFWHPGWVRTPKDEWQRTVETLVRREDWIMDGNYGGTIDIRLAAADTIIFLDFPRLLCLQRVIGRQFRYGGRSRPDLAEGCVERIKPDREFFSWIWNYRHARRPGILEKLVSLSDKNVFILRRPRDVERFLKTCAADTAKTALG